VKLKDIEKVDRNRDIPEAGIMADILWADPQKFNGRIPNRRGISIAFGPDITKKFLEDNNLELLVRSHEVKMNGYEVDHDDKLITIFSAPNYCDSTGNKGAFITFGSDMKPKFTQFGHVEHPNVKPMVILLFLFKRLMLHKVWDFKNLIIKHFCKKRSYKCHFLKTFLYYL
jgi:serine/threonine-protein phosphatase 5